MSKFETPSINEIFGKEREKFIPEVGEQLREETRAEIEINGEKLKIDYRVISIESIENKNSKPVILLQGFGSGWEGVAELGFSLACERRKVLMLSLPGYGKSDEPSEKYYKTNNFDNEAEVVSKVLDQAILDGKLPEGSYHLVGQSMGSVIISTFADKYPEKTESLVLLNAAGVHEEESLVKLASAFAISGTQTFVEFNKRMAFSDEKDYEKELRKYVPKSKSPIAPGRLPQRLAEGKKLQKNLLIDKIKKINKPIIYMASGLDSVFPPGSGSDLESHLGKVVGAVNDKTKLDISVFSGLRHNTTYAQDEITAANVEHYLEKAEQNN